ncbi:MAG: universal stress protein [Pseudomonadales bacterium]
MVGFDEIMVPVDGSEGSHRAARFGGQLAAGLQLPLKLAYVVPLTREGVMAFAKMTKEEVETFEHQQARSVLDKVVAAIGDTGADMSEVVLIGDPAEEILNYSAKHPKALLVMGRRGLSPIKSLMLGSVSEKVMRYAQGAVTVVN